MPAVKQVGRSGKQMVNSRNLKQKPETINKWKQ